MSLLPASRIHRFAPPLLISVGVLLLSSVIFPVLSSTFKYYLFRAPTLFDPTDVSSYPPPVVINTLGVSTDNYSSAEEWFPSVHLPPPITSSVKYFSLSLPRVGIIDLPVEVNGSDLKKNAIHFPGSALPGTFGNTVILGHSALPQFYTKDNPLTLFNPVVNLKPGDDLFLRFDSVNYHYVVAETKEISPEQISVLSQKYDRREVTLITCVPLGTYWRRFVARAEIVKSE